MLALAFNWRFSGGFIRFYSRHLANFPLTTEHALTEISWGTTEMMSVTIIAYRELTLVTLFRVQSRHA